MPPARGPTKYQLPFFPPLLSSTSAPSAIASRLENSGNASANFRGLPGLTLGEIGGFLAVRVVFVFRATLLADRFVAGEQGGARLEGELGAELGDDGVAKGGFVHALG
jgi:hypothetical protein